MAVAMVGAQLVCSPSSHYSALDGNTGRFSPAVCEFIGGLGWCCVRQGTESLSPRYGSSSGYLKCLRVVANGGDRDACASSSSLTGLKKSPVKRNTFQRRDTSLKPAEVRTVNGSLSRVGLVIGCPSLGLSMIDSHTAAAAAELDPISSSSTLSADLLLPRLVTFVGDLDPGTAQLVTSFVGPVITIFNLLFIFRIVMSWYPGIPVKKFPFFLAYNPTEPVLGPTRRLIPPVGGVDVAPVIWVALMSFANEILLGKQGLLVLLSQQQS